MHIHIEIEYGENWSMVDEFRVEPVIYDSYHVEIGEITVKRHGSSRWEPATLCHFLERYAEYDAYEGPQALQEAEQAIVQQLREAAEEASQEARMAAYEAAEVAYGALEDSRRDWWD